MNHAKWIAHFNRNLEDRPEPDWSSPRKPVPAEVLAPLVRSLEQFQLGDGGGPASLIAFDAERYRSSTEETRTLVDLSIETIRSFPLPDRGTGHLFSRCVLPAG